MPAAVAIRTFGAQVTQDASTGDVIVLVSPVEHMVGWGGTVAGFVGKRDGNTVRFDISNDIMKNSYAMVENISEVGTMGYVGTAVGTIDASQKIVATFNGEYRIGLGNGNGGCSAPDHRIDMTPVVSQMANR